MSGTWLTEYAPHNCPHPTQREARKRGLESATWQCECGDIWEYTVNWAGDGWDRRPR